MRLPILITIVFLALKLFHVIDWSWWWVVSPIWIFLLWAVSTALFCAVYDFKLTRRDK